MQPSKLALLSVAVSSAMALSACSNGLNFSRDSQQIDSSKPITNTKPTNVNIMEISSITKDDISLNWLTAKDDTTTTAQMRYEIHASTNQDFEPNNSTKIHQTVGKVSASINDKLTGGKTYYIKLVAIDKDNNKAISKAVPIDVSKIDAVTIVNSVTEPTNANKKLVEISDKLPLKITPTTITLPKGNTLPDNTGFVVSTNPEKPYLRKVVSSTKDPKTGETIVNTAPASLNEVVTEADISSAFKMSPLPNEVTQGLQTGLVQLNNDSPMLNWESTGYQYRAGNAIQKNNDDIHTNQSQPIQAGLATGNVIGGGSTTTKELDIKYPSKISIIAGESQTFNVSAIRLQKTDAVLCGFKKVRIERVTDKADTSTIDVSNVGNMSVKHRSNDGKAVLDASQSFKLTVGKNSPLGEKYNIVIGVDADQQSDNCSDSWNRWNYSTEIKIPIEILPEDVLPDEEEKELEEKESESLFKISGDITTTFDPIIEFSKDISWGRLQHAKIITKANANIKQELNIETRDAQSEIDTHYEVIKPRQFYKVYNAGGVPIIITGEMTLNMHVKGSATGKIKATETINIGYNNLVYGFEYTKANGYRVVTDYTPNHYLTVHGEGGASAELQISLVPSLKLSAYEVVSGRAVLEPYLKAGAGIEGHVDYVLGKAPDGYLGTGFDADYRLTEGYLSGGLNAYLAANLKVFDYQLAVWPNGAEIDDATKYDTYHQIPLIKETKFLGIPEMNEPTIDWNTTRPTDNRAIMIAGNITDVPFPFGSKKPLISWVQWTPPRYVNTQSTSTTGKIEREPSDWSKVWFTPTEVGTYTVRLGGYSSLGSWARQYADVQVEITDDNDNGIFDYWEKRHNVYGQDINSDSDNDGLTLLEEFNQGKNPTQSDNPVPVLKVDLPNIVITPAQPVKGEKFTIGLQGGNPDTFELVAWDYDGVQAHTATFDYTTNKSSIDVVLTLTDKQGQKHQLSERVDLIDKVVTPPVPTPTTTKLTATGVTLCSDDSRNNIACNSLSSAWLGLMQDGEVQAGQKMSYTTLNQNGAECVRDNVTGLIWEQKTDDGSLRDKDNTYTWYSKDNNGGYVGLENGGKNTYQYIQELNAMNYCGYNDWRLPTFSELDSIVDYGRVNPAINPIFTNTQSRFYWSSSPFASRNNYAWGVSFGTGGDDYYKDSSHYVRAVRSN